MRFGCHSMILPLRSVIVKTPEAAFRNQSYIDAHWQSLNYLSAPDYEKAIREHAGMTQILRKAGAEILFLGADDRTNLDSIYTHDPCIVTEAGAILFQTGKDLRRGEGPAMEKFMLDHGISILGKVEGSGRAEAGDMVWLDHKTLLIGRGFRTNGEGIASIRSLLGPLKVEMIQFDLPYWNGPGEVLHLMSFLSLVDDDLAVFYRPLMPAALFQLLSERGIQMIDVAEEYETLGCNVLAVAPRIVMIVEGNPITSSRLLEAGCEVLEFEGTEIAYKGTGGPTCLTRPVLRKK